MKHVAFQTLTEEQIHQLETSPHNPPTYSDCFTEEDFAQEWFMARERLESQLVLLGHPWSHEHPSGDYMLSDQRGEDRWIYLTFTSTRLWSMSFIVTVVEVLKSLSEDYIVACVTELDSAVDPNFSSPLVYLVISATTVRGRADRLSLDCSGTVTRMPANDELGSFGFPNEAITCS